MTKDENLQDIPEFLHPAKPDIPEFLHPESSGSSLEQARAAGASAGSPPGYPSADLCAGGQVQTDQITFATAAAGAAANDIDAQDGPKQQLLSTSPEERRWAWVQVDKEAISQNLKSLRKVLGPDPLILVVVKADGYGHGAVEVAKVALRSGARYLGVASVTEGVELRRAGISAPVLILSEPPSAAVREILHHDLTPAVYTHEFALALAETAAAQGRVAKYHLKIDSGLNRIGVHYSDAGDFLRSLDFHKALALEGCFTHFATADIQDSFGLQTQQERFEQGIATIRYMGVNPGIIHAANSAAAIRFKQLRYDMVRLGISVYGLHPSKLTRSLITLRPAMSVHARVNSIKAVPIGEGVGYGFNYRSPGGVLIATLPIGYGDGLSRALSEQINVLVEGHSYPQVGTICMDMCMFEVSQRPDISNLRRAQISANRPSVEFGSEAIIVGKSGDLRIEMDELAEKIGTINYDLACMFGLRLERVYRE